MKTTILKSVMMVLVALFSLNTYAYDFEVDGLYYNVVSLSDLTCELTKGDNQYTKDISIPSYVNYKSKTFMVVGIAASTFKDNQALTSVTFPNTLLYIGQEAFRFCI